MSLRVLALAFGSVIVLAGCGGGQGDVLHSGSSIVLVDADHSDDNVAGVGYGGDVAMAGDCLGIDGVTVLWPHGTSIVSDNPLTIDVPGLGRVTLGDRLAGGAVRYGRPPKGIGSIPSACPTQQVVAFLPDR